MTITHIISGEGSEGEGGGEEEEDLKEVEEVEQATTFITLTIPRKTAARRIHGKQKDEGGKGGRGEVVEDLQHEKLTRKE